MDKDELLRMKDLASERLEGLNIERMSVVLQYLKKKGLKFQDELYDEFDKLGWRKQWEYKSFFEWVYKTKIIGDDKNGKL